ncbi:major facilitator superfamily domain-containing protein [Zychaea mexicana]|uniref:major facilitator superfamily domain-containing protein n=1 Tax=Zychaea mexicana TaxID=64656 RepID=UPI0022FF0A05|nr:major facilitator superfamily domain-containing protein [Zychaea mexicana]KAI9489601.1 major facilitator superfamily domain-containing protein [Zychaea mexicana]
MDIRNILFRRLASPLVQVVLLGFVCLCCPGMFNALNGLGAGGMMASDIALVNSANSALYACFAVVGFFAGSVTNTLGVKTTLTIGSAGYAVYSSSLWVYDAKQVSGYVIASGAILGCCAGIFWSAQGAIMMAYPEEKNKGKYVAIFWTLFNIGGILGSVITLGINLESGGDGGVSTGTYTAFVVIMIVGIFLSLILAPPSMVVRSDGTHVSVTKSAHWLEELKGVIRVWKEWRIICLIPAFLASNWFYAYQFHVNAVYFDATTRALNGTMYWGMQIIASIIFGFILDYQGLSRRVRALLGAAILFVVMMAIWAGGLVFQLSFENDYDDPIHWTDSRFGRPFLLYIFYGFSDALYQSYLYWLMGAMSNDPKLLARYAGFYKAMQSAGAAISFGIDSAGVRLRWACVVCWVIVTISFPGMFVVANQISQTNAPAEDTVDNDSSSTEHNMSVMEKPSQRSISDGKYEV